MATELVGQRASKYFEADVWDNMQLSSLNVQIINLFSHSKREKRGVMHQTGLVQWTWKITSISNDPDAKDEHDGASS